MDIIATAIKNIFYPAWMIKDGNIGVLKYLNYFDYIDGLKRGELEDRQLKGVKKILVHAYEQTNYYRRLFDKLGFSPYDFKNKNEIEVLPLLTKDIIRREYNDLIAKNIPSNECFEANTGGSTGTPMKFLRDRRSLYLRRGQEIYFDGWLDSRIGDKVALFVAASHFDGKLDFLKAKIRNSTCERMIRFDPHEINESYLESFLPKFIKFGPKIIKCFPNSLLTFAHYIKKKGVTVPSVKSILCTGENMYSNQKTLFETVFRGDVYEKYATRESGIIASECRERNGMHIFTEGVFLELLSEDNKPVERGEVGKIVLTDLFNHGMPLIRYEIGDMAVQSDGRLCSCGSELPMIEKILGRDRDIVIDSDGNPKPGYLFVEAILSMNKTSQFQVIQPDRDSLIVKIAKKENEDINLSQVELNFKKIVGSNVHIRFEFVNSISRDPSGKYSYVKSQVPWE